MLHSASKRAPLFRSGIVIAHTARSIFALVGTSLFYGSPVFGAPASWFWFTHFPCAHVIFLPKLLSCSIFWSISRVVQLLLIVCFVSTVVLTSFSLLYFVHLLCCSDSHMF
ncbi:hypothetical protein QL285_018534 [Trifolium repens]|nr:hypothetical protein QL285_018534 [Trifolium repens]